MFEVMRLAWMYPARVGRLPLSLSRGAFFRVDRPVLVQTAVEIKRRRFEERYGNRVNLRGDIVRS